MPADDALLFIDTNKYLDLYRTDKGKKLLEPLGEQESYIFVTQQVVNEVQRNKILVSAEFLSQKYKGLKLQTFNVPDHFSGADAAQNKDIFQRQMKEIGQEIKRLNGDVDAFTLSIIQQISRSEDEVSKALSPIFAKASAHSPEEMQRARDRRELGNPPGKSADPIGDQLTWEQILTHFKGKKRLWIISRDSDYGTVYGGKRFLNCFLYDELRRVTSDVEVYLFTETREGIDHFVKTTGVKAEKRLTPEDAEEIDKEEKSLPHLPESSEDVRRAIAALAKLPQLSEAMLQSEKLQLSKATMSLVDAASAVLAQQGEAMFQALSAPVVELARKSEALSAPLAEIARKNAAMIQAASAPFAEIAQQNAAMLQAVSAASAGLTEQNAAMLRAASAASAGLTEQNAAMLRAASARLLQPQTPTYKSPKGDHEEKDEQPPSLPPPSQKGDNEEAS